MKYNVKPVGEKLHEGVVSAVPINNMARLRRSVCSCLLGEREFYEDGQSIFDRITNLSMKVSIGELAALAIETRKVHKLRSVPLLLLSVLAERGQGAMVADTINEVITRPDQMTEFLAIHAERHKVGLDKIKPIISAQMKKGLARCFQKFDKYQLGKYNRDGMIKLKDVLFLVHPKPLNSEQAQWWNDLANDKLEAPYTWEVELSAGKDKNTTFTNLLTEGKLGYLALLRNLRNMYESSVSLPLVKKAILARKGAQDVLPFRYVAAARQAPAFTTELSMAMQKGVEELEHLSGNTIVLVDVSGSMDAKLSAKSDITRMDAAATLAAILPGYKKVFTFSSKTVEVKNLSGGIEGIKQIISSQGHSFTNLADAIKTANQYPYDRLVVITDEQANVGKMVAPKTKNAYMINVASYKNGVGYGGNWIHIDGFSENVLRFVREIEKLPEDWL